jgi:hypothetical protein
VFGDEVVDDQGHRVSDKSGPLDDNGGKGSIAAVQEEKAETV